MSGPGRAAGAVNVQRKTWDKSQYAEKAKERAEGFVEEEKVGPAPYRAAPAGLAGPEGSERAYLPSRDVDLQLDSKLGKKRLVTEATPMAQVGGYWCEICQCTLRDSTTYLDHINGVKHQRRLGFSMRVERSTVDGVKSKLQALKAQVAGGSGLEASGSSAGGGNASSKKAGGGAGLDAEDRYALAAMDHPDIAVVAAGPTRALPAVPGVEAAPREGGSGSAAAAPGVDGVGEAGKRKRDEGAGVVAAGAASGGRPEAAGEEEGDEMAALLGFSGFGGSKKAR